MPSVLLTGATGYVGGRLAAAARRATAAGCAAWCAIPTARRRRVRPHAGAQGDALTGEGLDAALDGVEVAYYLVHSMGKGGADFEDARPPRRTRRSAPPPRAPACAA